MKTTIEDAIKEKKIREMKNPKILMNNEDFEEFKLSANVVDNSFQGITIVSNSLVDKGTFFVFDEITTCW